MARIQQSILNIFLDYCMFHGVWNIIFTEIILHSGGEVHYLLVAFLARTRDAIRKISGKSQSRPSMICLKQRCFLFAY